MTRTAVHTVVFFFVAPGLVAGLVPWWLTGWQRPDATFGVVDVLGLGLIGLGLLAVVDCFVRFVREGLGTPAPTSPTEFLVVGGLYRHVRNPMYVAVGSAIAGEALILRSTELAAWFLIFVAMVVSFVKGYEEPTLRRRFGTSYERYREAVPGWWPRLSPWRG
jgi:protein-S-isoprenylcysteine O-methyltransferase Ste14